MYTGSLKSRAVRHKMNRNGNRHYCRSPTLLGVTVCLAFLLWWHWDKPALGTSLSWRFRKENSSENDLAFPVPGTKPIPSKIWQIHLPKHTEERASIDPGSIADTTSWLASNPGFQYTLVGQELADAFVDYNFADDPIVVETYHNTTNVGQKSDLLRYLILYIEGGIYTDTDTYALRPIDEWAPPDVRDQVHLIVGVEFDRRDDGAWPEIPHWVQFCQWTIAAAPRHPVLRRMVDHAVLSLAKLHQNEGQPDGETHPTSFEVMTSTGPAAWTDVVFEQLQEYENSLNGTEDLSFMAQPKLYEDILVLTVDGFGMGQPHSHSTNDGTIPEAALVKHNFRGSWRDN